MTIDRCDITAPFATNGEIRCNIGRLPSGQGISASCPVYGVWGIFSMPAEPTQGECAQAIYSKQQNWSAIFGIRDNRLRDRVGELTPGDVMVCTLGEARIIIKRQSDSVTIYTANQQDGDKSMMVHLNGASGEILLVNGGTKYSQTTSKFEMVVNGGGSLVIDGQGVRVGGPQFNADCGAGTFGLLPGGVRPVVGVNSVLGGVSGFAGLPSSAWVVAT